MKTESDLRSTLKLPKTDFPMKANLAQSEPQRLARWKQQARLLESVRRLAGGTPVTRVALDLGYESPSAFSTMFRRSLGIAPRAFIAGDNTQPQ